jgi:hypothetical protein
MSQLGHSRRFCPLSITSGLSPTPDIPPRQKSAALHPWRVFCSCRGSTTTSTGKSDWQWELNVLSKSPVPRVAEYYVLLCARRYAEAIEAVSRAGTQGECQRARQRLSDIWQGGMIEYARERERRERRYPNDLQKALVEKDGSTISRVISPEEFEIVR